MIPQLCGHRLPSYPCSPYVPANNQLLLTPFALLHHSAHSHPPTHRNKQKQQNQQSLFKIEGPPFLEIAPQDTAHRSVFSTLTKCHHRMRVASVLLDLSPCCSLLATKIVLALPIIGAEGPEVATMGGLVLDGASFDG